MHVNPGRKALHMLIQQLNDFDQMIWKFDVSVVAYIMYLSPLGCNHLVSILLVCTCLAMWTLDDIKKDLEDTSNLLKHKKEKSTLGEADVKKLEDSLVVSIEHKLSSLKWNAKHALEFHTLLDSCGSFSTEMTTKLRHKVDTLLVEPVATPSMQMTLRPQSLSIPSYLTEEDWGYINGTHSYHTKIAILCKRAKSLGVQSASEQTTKSIAATFLCGLTTLPEPSAMRQIVSDVKLSMASMAAPAGLPFVLKYPANPLDLPQELLAAAYGPASPACKIPDKYTIVLKQVPLRVTHASLQKKEKGSEITPATNQASASNSSSSTGFTGVPDMQQQMQQFKCMMSMGMQAFQNKKSFKALLDIKTPEKEKEATPATQHVEQKPAVAALMDQTMTAAVAVPATEVATLQPKLRTQTSTQQECTLPTKAEGETPNNQPVVDGAEVEEAAFGALKNRSTTAKAKAKGKRTPKHKAKAKPKATIMKKPSASTSFKSKHMVQYKCPLPEDKWMSSTKESWTSKHYHTARELAKKSGLDDDSAKAYGREARAQAVLAWDKKFG